MSAFDLAMACTQNMLECLNQNHFETPPYGPVPDAALKLRTAVRSMTEALIVAMAAEAQGIAMPPVPELPTGETLAVASAVHEGHRVLAQAQAEALATMPEPEDAPEPAYVPPDDPDDEV